jgi:hypothetical protein
MIGPPIGKDPVTIIRFPKQDGEFLYSREECERLLGLYLEKAKKIWKEEAAGTTWKPTGRGRLFWIHSE